MDRNFLIVGLVALAAGIAWVVWPAQGQGPLEAPTPSALAQGAELYAANCASCHGASLEGEENWRLPGPDGRLPAPPHDETGHTWHHGDDLLFAYTKYGGEDLMARRGIAFRSGMPGFGDVLSDEEIRLTLEFIKSTWPEEIRQIQAGRTAAERSGG